MNIDTREITLEPADNARLLSLCGPFDDNIKQLERRLGIEINRRDNHFKLTGRPICVTAAADILRSLYVDTAPMRGQTQDIEPEQIHLAIKEARVLEQSADSVPEFGKAVNIKTKRGVIKPRTPNQAQYIANILDHDITFGVGPAGTGKTYLAVAAAVDALERQEIRRILLTRPAVEAGEKLGFLPEAQNDMIFSIICEELGLVGASFVLLLFLILIWRFFVIASHAPDLEGALIASGAMAHMMIQVILNIAVVTNTIPNTGITLPFISYGGTSVMFLLFEMGLVLNVSSLVK